MEGSVRIGTIKKCPGCGDENYVRADAGCPSCGKDFNYVPEKKSPDVIVFLGNGEINRRTVVELSKQGLIDDFSR